MEGFSFPVVPTSFFFLDTNLTATTMPQTNLGQDSRVMVENVNQTIVLCAEDTGSSKTQLRSFIKENKDRFSEQNIALLLD